MNPVLCNRIDHRPIPRRAFGVANFNIIGVVIRPVEIHSALDAFIVGATIVIDGDGGSRGNKVGLENSANDRYSRTSIRLGEESGVDVCAWLSFEFEFLGKGIGIFVGRVGDVNWCVILLLGTLHGMKANTATSPVSIVARVGGRTVAAVKRKRYIFMIIF